MVRRLLCFFAAACVAGAAVRSYQVSERTPVRRFVLPQDGDFVIARAARLWDALAR